MHHKRGPLASPLQLTVHAGGLFLAREATARDVVVKRETLRTRLRRKEEGLKAGRAQCMRAREGRGERAACCSTARCTVRRRRRPAEVWTGPCAEKPRVSGRLPTGATSPAARDPERHP